MSVKESATIIVLAHNCCAQLLSTLESLHRLPERWPIIVVDNGSTDNTAAAVALRFRHVMLIRCKRNLGAAARNIGVACAHTPYVAFCDYDTQWEPGALNCAVRLLDNASDVAVLSACVQVGATRELDRACVLLHNTWASAHPRAPQMLDFMAGACVMRTRAFYDVGGYWPPLFAGGEEALMALDLAERGWRIIYAKDVVIRRFSVRARNPGPHEKLMVRNAIWVAWMRRPLRMAWHETRVQLIRAHIQTMFWRTLLKVLIGLPRALQRRKVISPAVEEMTALVDRAMEHALILDADWRLE